MALEDILSSIREEAKTEADAILASADERAARILEDANKRAEETKDAVVTASRKRGEDLLNSANTRAVSLKRRAVLKAKQDMLARVFREALAKMRHMSQEDYVNLLMDMVKASSRGGEDILMAEEDREKAGALADMVSAWLLKEGKTPVTFSYQEESLGGGFILRRDKIALNKTFPAVFYHHKDELEVEVARILFND